jgi:putative transposase
MKAEKPGEMMQIDHITVSVALGFSIKHFEATCPFTKVTISQAYLNASSKTAALFLTFVKEKLPFKLHSIQVDGGSEFMRHFEDACQAYDIPLYVIPPRTPELNGCVERCNRTLRYEFYHCYDGLPDLKALRKSLSHYMHIYNTYRPHQSLNQTTPLAYYQPYFMEAA